MLKNILIIEELVQICENGKKNHVCPVELEYSLYVFILNRKHLKGCSIQLSQLWKMVIPWVALKDNFQNFLIN